MPRKPKPPLPELHIEGLSTFDTVATSADTFADDFTGEAKPLAPEIVQARKASDKYRREQQALVSAKARKHEDEYQALRRGAIEHVQRMMQPTLRSPAKPGEQAIALGSQLVIIPPRKTWRRL